MISDNRSPLEINKRYRFNKNGINKVKEFTITEIIGKGASCIVYTAEDIENHNNRVRIKEYFPMAIPIERMNNGSLFIRDNKKFDEGKLLFEKTYYNQIDLRKNDVLANSISNTEGIFYCNNTIYIVMTYNFGQSYDMVQDKNLNYIFRVALAVAKAIGEYHKKGLLHLDIKPANILVMPETPDSIILFDFDSIVSKSDLHSGNVKVYSYSEKWAAPEQLQHKTANIGEATDIYSIGAMVFQRIFQRPILPSDRSFNCDSEINYSDNYFFDNVNPKIYSILTRFFSKTLYSYPKSRYQSVDELIINLQQLIKLSDISTPYIITKNIPLIKNFVGRFEEFQTIDHMLDTNDTLFVYGIGGLGKSELIKQYTKYHKYKFDVICLINYETNLITAINNDDNILINNFFHIPNETPEKYFERKINLLRKLCDNRTLLIFDNYDIIDNANISRIFSLKCKKVFTTRIDHSSKYAQMNLSQLDFNSIKTLYIYNGINIDESGLSSLKKIYDIFGGNALVMEFIINQIKEYHISIEQLLFQIEQQNPYNSNSIYSFFYFMLRFDKLNSQEILVLQKISTSSLSGISSDILLDICDLSNYEYVNTLISKGWIKFHQSSARFVMHSVIREIITRFLIPKSDISENLISTLNDASLILNKISQFDTLTVCRKIFSAKQKISGRTIQYFEDTSFNKSIMEATNHYLNLYMNEYPIFLFDNSVFCNNSSGFVITNKGIHTKYLNLNKCKFISYSEISKLYVINKNDILLPSSTLNALLKNGDNIIIYSGKVNNCNYFYKAIISFLYQITLAYTNMLLNSTHKAAIRISPLTSYKIKYFVKQRKLPISKYSSFENNIDKKLINGEYSSKYYINSKNIRIYAHESLKFINKLYHYKCMKKSEYPFIVVDDSDFGSGTSGFLLTNENVYLHPLHPKKVSFNSINQIVLSSLPLNTQSIDLILDNMERITLTLSNKENDIKTMYDILCLFFDCMSYLTSE